MDGEKNRIFIIRGLILGGLIILLVIFLLINKSNQRDFVTKEITPTVLPTRVVTLIPTQVAMIEPTVALRPTSIPTATKAPVRVLTVIPTIKPTAIPTSIYTTGVSLSAVLANLYPGERQQITAKVEPDNAINKTVAWASSDENVASVTDNGLIIANDVGIAIITATTSNKKTTRVEVVVREKPIETETSISINETIYPMLISLNVKNVLIKKGRTFNIKYNFVPVNTNQREVIWSSSDMTVATVDSSGVVTAKSPGKTTITAKTVNNRIAVAEFTVEGEGTTSIVKPTNIPTITPIPTTRPLIPTKTPTPVKKMIYIFKYDENNRKPMMKCDTYTAQDRVYLEKLLEQTVNEAGRGTRAGVVAAARFLVGGLDYKVPYLGQKRVDSTLGIYNKLGLNIGNSKAWGCLVSGWTQGLDCTHFVSWALVNGGLSWSEVRPQLGAVPLRENVSRVRPGDFLLTLSDGSVSWTYSHTSIVIAVDSDYIYVAEEKEIGLVVSKVSKSDLPSRSSNLGMVSFGKYPSDGKMTNMWNE